MRQPNQDCYIQMKQNVIRAQQSERGDNDLLGIDNNRQLFYDCYTIDDVFYSCLNAKVNANGSYTTPRKTPSRNYIFPKNTWPKLHYPEHTFP